MKTVVLTLVLLLFPALSYGYQAVASCNTANADVLVRVQYTSNRDTVIASNIASFVLPATGNQTSALYDVRAKTNNSGDSLLTLSVGIFQIQSCAPYVSEFSSNLLMGLAGLICASMLFYSILAAYLH